MITETIWLLIAILALILVIIYLLSKKSNVASVQLGNTLLLDENTTKPKKLNNRIPRIPRADMFHTLEDNDECESDDDKDDRSTYCYKVPQIQKETSEKH